MDSSFIPINLESNNVVVQNIPIIKNVNNNESFIIELDIDSIFEKEFTGKEKKINANNTITPSNNDLLELTIVVKPPVHKERR